MRSHMHMIKRCPIASVVELLGRGPRNLYNNTWNTHPPNSPATHANLPEVVHVGLEVAVVAAHDLFLAAQRAVAVLPLPRVCGDLCAPVCERLLQLDQLAHALLNHTCSL